MDIEYTFSATAFVQSAIYIRKNGINVLDGLDCASIDGPLETNHIAVQEIGIFSACLFGIALASHPSRKSGEVYIGFLAHKVPTGCNRARELEQRHSGRPMQLRRIQWANLALCCFSFPTSPASPCQPLPQPCHSPCWGQTAFIISASMQAPFLIVDPLESPFLFLKMHPDVGLIFAIGTTVATSAASNSLSPYF